MLDLGGKDGKRTWDHPGSTWSICWCGMRIKKSGFFMENTLGWLLSGVFQDRDELWSARATGERSHPKYPPQIPAGIPQERNNLLAQALPPQKFSSSGNIPGGGKEILHGINTLNIPKSPRPGFWGVPSGGTRVSRFPAPIPLLRERKGNRSYSGNPGLLFPRRVGIFTDPRKMRRVSCCQNRNFGVVSAAIPIFQHWECWNMGIG